MYNISTRNFTWKISDTHLRLSDERARIGKIAGILRDEGFEATAREIDADIIVFNTCCIRETAEAKIMGHIGQIKKIKKARPELKVAVCGCMSQQEGAAQLILDKFPFVDAVLGTANLHLLKEVVAKADNTSKNRFSTVIFLETTTTALFSGQAAPTHG